MERLGRKLLVFLFFSLFCASAFAVCTWYNPLTWSECFIPAVGFVAAPFQAVQSISGFPDSDLLVLSATPTYLTGQNQPLVGNVVKAEVSVGSGNDVAAVGSFDEERISITVADIGSATYYLSGKKVEMNTTVRLSGTERTLRRIGRIGNQFMGQSGTENGYPIGIVWDEAQEQESLKVAGYNAQTLCKREEGSDFAGVGWRPIVASDLTFGQVRLSHSICTSGFASGAICVGGVWQPQVYFKCYAFDSEFNPEQISYQDFGTKTVNAVVDLQLTSNNGDSSVLTFASGDCGRFGRPACLDRGYFTFGFEQVGYARITGFRNPVFELPLDLTDEAPAIYKGSRYIIDEDFADSAWLQLTALQAQIPLNDIDWKGNFAEVQGKILSYENNFVQTVNSKDTRFNGVWGFEYEPAIDSFVIDDAYIRDLELEVIVLGEWIGLIRDVAEFDVVCGADVEAVEQTTVYSTVTVKNISDVSGATSLIWSCPPTNGSRQVSLPARQSQTFDIPFSLSHEGSGQCQFFVGTKSCTINYNFTGKPDSCGNGIPEPELGETCVNCPSDVICIFGTICDSTIGSPTYGQCVLVIPPPPPPPPEFDWRWVIVGVLLVAGAGLIIYGYYGG